MGVLAFAPQARNCRSAPRARIGGWTTVPAPNRVNDEERDSVPVFLLREALSCVEGRGLDVAALLGEAGIALDSLDQPDAFITPKQFGCVWYGVARDLDEEFFFQDPRGMPKGSFVLICHAVMHCDSLERAIRRMLRFYHVLFSGFDARLSLADGVAQIEIVESGAGRSTFGYAMFLVQFLSIVCWLIDRRIPLTGAQFCSPCAAGANHYRRLLCDKLEFGAATTSFQFDADFLAIRPTRTDMQLCQFLRDSPGVFLTHYRSRDSLSTRIFEQLRVTPPQAWPAFHELAERLYTTPSTLRRRLDDERNSYQRIKDSVRQQWAIEKLTANVMSNAEIAEELGFGDPSTFYRAFRKWTGATPNSYRAPAAPIG